MRGLLLPHRPAIVSLITSLTRSFAVVSFVAVVSLDDLKIDGEPNEYRDSATDSGNTTSRFFCGRCGSPVHTQGPSRPGKTVVKLGLFARDGLKLDKPVAQLFTKNRHAWEVPYEGAEQHEGMPKAA